MKERSKKENETFQLFEKRKEKKILPERTKLCVVRILGLFEKKTFSKEDSKTLESVLRTWRDMVKKAGKDICQKQIREIRR